MLLICLCDVFPSWDCKAASKLGHLCRAAPAGEHPTLGAGRTQRGMDGAWQGTENTPRLLSLLQVLLLCEPCRCPGAVRGHPRGCLLAGAGGSEGPGGAWPSLAMLVVGAEPRWGRKTAPPCPVTLSCTTGPPRFPSPGLSCPQARVTSALAGTTGSDTPLPAFPEPARGGGLGARSPRPARGRWPGRAPPRPARCPCHTEPGTAGRQHWADPLLSAQRSQGCCRGPKRGQSASAAHLD